jgi:mannose/fructose-specific phosphotransferase system component IIA
VVVAHDEVAAALVRAVERISGVRGGLRAVSNESCAPEELRRRVDLAVADGPALVFVDMASGSCAFAGRQVGRDRPEVAVVTGVNLPMLLDFIFHREMELGALARRVAEKGRAATHVHLSDVQEGHVDRATSD